MTSKQKSRISGKHLFAATLVIVSLPSLYWYISRMSDGSDEPYGILALVAWCYFLPWRRLWIDWKAGLLPGRMETAVWLLVILAIALLPNLPDLIRAGLLIAGFSFSGLIRGMPRGATILGFLSLPILASLDFYLGYPLRLACGWIGTEGLQAVGLPVSLEGITMAIGGREIVIDRPCSGLKYLWFGWFISGYLASSMGLEAKRVAVLSFFTGAALFLANVLRVTVLFLLEWKGWGGADSHEVAGLILFGLSLFVVYQIAKKIGAKQPEIRMLEKKTLPAFPYPRILWSVTLLVVLLPSFIGLFYKTEQQVEARQQFTQETRFDDSWLGETILERAFNEGGLPARMYRSDDALVLLREIPRPTRRLHSAEDCFRGAGWKVKTSPLWKDPYERNWRRFQASKNDVHLEVRQRIEGADGWSGTDVSQWFWSAVSGQTKGPWKAWVIVREA